jgi:hypothetical protein
MLKPMMRTYESKFLFKALEVELNKLRRKHASPINALKTAWEHMAPDWLKLTQPTMIKDGTLFLKSWKNNLLIQYREQEIIKFANLITPEEIKKIKILSS